MLSLVYPVSKATLFSCNSAKTKWVFYYTHTEKWTVYKVTKKNVHKVRYPTNLTHSILLHEGIFGIHTFSTLAKTDETAFDAVAKYTIG